MGCGTKLWGLRDLEAHYVSQHTVTCSVCACLFPTTCLLNLHVSETHNSFFKAKVACNSSQWYFLVNSGSFQELSTFVTVWCLPPPTIVCKHQAPIAKKTIVHNHIVCIAIFWLSPWDEFSMNAWWRALQASFIQTLQGFNIWYITTVSLTPSASIWRNMLPSGSCSDTKLIKLHSWQWSPSIEATI